jgi:synaptosomal-associated protein 29
MFSGFKNLFTKPAAATTASGGTSDVKSTSSSSDNALARTLEQQQQGGGGNMTESTHPALRMRGLENDFSPKPLSSVDEQLEQDLGEMSQSLARLKGLAKGLGTEIDDQNQLIDRIQSSTDKADWRIQRQNKDMERLLKK